MSNKPTEAVFDPFEDTESEKEARSEDEKMNGPTIISASRKLVSSTITGTEFDSRYPGMFHKITEGGEKTVYGPHEEEIQKVRKQEKLSKGKSSGFKRDVILKTDTHPPKLLKEEAERYLQSERKRFAMHREFFGKHVVPTHIHVVPGTLDISDIQHYVLLECQLAVPEILIEEGEYFPLCIGYAENIKKPLEEVQTEIYNESYEGISEALVALKEGEKVDLRSLLSENERLSKLLKQIEQDLELRNTLQDFVQRAIRYANETGELIDIMGGGRSGNVIFMKRKKKVFHGPKTQFQKILWWLRGKKSTIEETKDEWTYRMIDIDMKMPGEKYPQYLSLNNMKKTLEKLEDNVNANLDENDYANLVNGLNFVRGINGLASALAMPDRVHLFKDIEIDFAKINRRINRVFGGH